MFLFHKENSLHTLTPTVCVSVFRQRGRLLLAHFSQEQPFDLSQKSPTLAGLRLPQSDGESVPGSSCQEEDEESLYRRSQYSPEVEQHEVEEESPGELRPAETRGSESPTGVETHRVRSEGTAGATDKSDSEHGDDVRQRPMYSCSSESEADTSHQELDDSEKRNQEKAGDFSDAG